MLSPNPISSMLADMVRYTSHGNRWHRLAAAAEGLRPKDLRYKPVRVPWGWGKGRRSVHIVRSVLLHLTAAAHYGDHLAPRSRARVEDDWEQGPWHGSGPWKNDPEVVVQAVDAALRRLHARAKRVTDEELPVRCGMWPADSPKLFVLIDGGILHTAWHLGQVAMLVEMSHAREQEKMVAPSGPTSPAPKYPGDRDWADCRVASRTEACLKLLEASHRESPWHAIRRMVSGVTRAEATWKPFPQAGPWRSIHGLAHHVAACKVIYGDQAFGTRALDWPDCASILGLKPGTAPGPRTLVRALDLGHEFLMEVVARATDADLDRKNPMHHHVPHTGWQTVAAMAQHDAWHGGQISILRDAFFALTE